MGHFFLARGRPELAAGRGGWSILLAEYARANAWRVGREQLCRLLSTARQFIQACGAESPDGVTVSAIESWLGELAASGRSVKTCINKLSCVERFCDFLYCRGLLLNNPARQVRRPRAEQGVPNVLSRHELAAVLRQARRSGILCPVALACYAGLRVGEIRHLRWEEVDLTARRLIVRRAKGKRPRVVPLHRVVLAALRAHRRRSAAQGPAASQYVFPGGRGRGGAGTWTLRQPRGRDWWMKKALRPIQEAMPEVFGRVPRGQCGRGWHLFRHTWVTRMIQAGATAAKVAQWAGHANLVTLQRYIHLAAGYDAEIDLM